MFPAVTTGWKMLALNAVTSYFIGLILFNPDQNSRKIFPKAFNRHCLSTPGAKNEKSASWRNISVCRFRTKVDRLGSMTQDKFDVVKAIPNIAAPS